jgi:hypothetical protein
MGNKLSHAVHLECELHNLAQGEISVNDYCQRLQQLANALTDCDTSIGDCSLVHQLIRGLNPKFSVLKTLLSLLPWFPSFIEVRELLSEEASQDADAKRSTETALLAVGGTSPKANNNTAPPLPPDCSNNNNNFFSDRGCGGRGEHGRDHGGHNNGHGNNSGSNSVLIWSSPAS